MRLVLTQMSHVKLKTYLLYLGVSVFVTTLFWIGYSIYDAYSKPIKNPEVEALLTPLNPTLNTQALSLISDRFNPPDTFNIRVVRDGVPGIIPPPSSGNSLRFIPVATESGQAPSVPPPSTGNTPVNFVP
jgi:hypothetical protein